MLETYGQTYRVVTVSGGEDPVMGIGQNTGKGGLAGPLWPVEHLGLQPETKHLNVVVTELLLFGKK